MNPEPASFISQREENECSCTICADAEDMVIEYASLLVIRFDNSSDGVMSSRVAIDMAFPIRSYRAPKVAIVSFRLPLVRYKYRQNLFPYAFAIARIILFQYPLAIGCKVPDRRRRAYA